MKVKAQSGSNADIASSVAPGVDEINPKNDEQAADFEENQPVVNWATDMEYSVAWAGADNPKVLPKNKQETKHEIRMRLQTDLKRNPQT